jgi:hypothetical protein
MEFILRRLNFAQVDIKLNGTHAQLSLSLVFGKTRWDAYNGIPRKSQIFIFVLENQA